MILFPHRYKVALEVVTGCNEGGPGCKNCISRYESKELQELGNPRYRNGFQLSIHESELIKFVAFNEVKKRKSVVVITPNSDLFHKDVPDNFIIDTFDVTDSYLYKHFWKVCTKRSKRLLQLSHKLSKLYHPCYHIGVTIDSPSHYYRIENLRKTQAGSKYLSLCPLTQPMQNLPLEGINAVVSINEIGDHPRPYNPAWAADVRRQCRQAVVGYKDDSDHDRLIIPFSQLKKGAVGLYRRSMVFQLLERTQGITAIPTEAHPVYPKFIELWGKLKQLSNSELKERVGQVAPEFFEP